MLDGCAVSCSEDNLTALVSEDLGGRAGDDEAYGGQKGRGADGGGAVVVLLALRLGRGRREADQRRQQERHHHRETLMHVGTGKGDAMS